MPIAPPRPSSELAPLQFAWLCGELGILIAVPLVVWLILGIKLDRYLGTEPLWMLLGIALALVSSTLLIARKIKQLTTSSRV